MGYRVIRSLGGGGMGTVWLCARRLGLADVTQRAVVKRPRSVEEGGSVASTTQRFIDEVRALARIEHRNVVRLLDAGADAAGPWLAVEHVDGVDGAGLLESVRGAMEVDPGAGLTGAEIGWIIHEAAAGLVAAHGAVDDRGMPAPVLHRDVSPQNLLLSRGGEVKLADFGIARPTDGAAHTTTGVVVGNLRYIAPEQLEGRAVTARTDVYGLGRVLEELLTAAAPNAHDASVEALQRLAARCTNRSPEERPESAAAVRDVVREGVAAWSTGEPRLAGRVRRAVDAREQMRAAVAGLLGTSGETGEVATRRSETAALPRAVRASLVPAAPETRPRTVRLGVVTAAVAAVLLLAVAATWREKKETAAPPTPPVTLAMTHALVTAEDAAPTTVTVTDAGVTRTVVVAHEIARVATRRVVVDAGVEPAAPRATLRVSSLPFALVSVDGSPPVGTPHAFALGAGEHTVTARFATDGSTGVVRRVVTLAPGETTTLGFTPE